MYLWEPAVDHLLLLQTLTAVKYFPKLDFGYVVLHWILHKMIPNLFLYHFFLGIYLFCFQSPHYISLINSAPCHDLHVKFDCKGWNMLSSCQIIALWCQFMRFTVLRSNRQTHLACCIKCKGASHTILYLKHWLMQLSHCKWHSFFLKKSLLWLIIVKEACFELTNKIMQKI